MSENPLQRLDGFELVKLGKASVTVGGLAAAVLIVAVALIAARLTSAGLQRLRARAVGAAASLYVVEKVVTYGLVIIGFVAGLSTMGLDPVDVLILPRIVALVLALPILTFIGSMAALYGGGLVAWFYGGMGPAIFIARLHDAVSIASFEVGMIKAPFMALVIGIVACSEGLRVKGSAESLGKQTTTSVVKSIFLVIVLDGMFAIFFASVGM